jgi:hypothetical protein
VTLDHSHEWGYSGQRDESLELRRLALDEKRLAQDVELRREELELKRREHGRSALASPLFLAVVASALGLIGNAVVATLNGTSTRELERTRAETQLELQKAQAEASLVLEAIKTGDTEAAAANLEFMVASGLISPRSSLQDYLTKRKPGQGPVLPPQRPDGVGTVPESLEQEIQRNVSLFDSDDRKAAAARVVAIAARGPLEKQAVVSACLKALAPIDDHYRTDLYAVLTLSRLDDGWCAAADQHKKVVALPVGHPHTVDDAFMRAHTAAIEKYNGECAAHDDPHPAVASVQKSASHNP